MAGGIAAGLAVAEVQSRGSRGEGAGGLGLGRVSGEAHCGGNAAAGDQTRGMLQLGWRRLGLPGEAAACVGAWGAVARR